MWVNNKHRETPSCIHYVTLSRNTVLPTKVNSVVNLAL